jgi:hypothetical protein
MPGSSERVQVQGRLTVVPSPFVSVEESALAE